MKDKIISTIWIVLGAVLLFSSFIYIRSSRPMVRAKKEAIEIAKEYTDLETVNQFYWFTREETYFTLTGTTKEEKEIVVIIPKSGEKVTVLNQGDGLTETKALRNVIDNFAPKNIIKITLGMYKDEAVWEITAEDHQKKLNYYLLSFKTGDVVRIIKNV